MLCLHSVADLVSLSAFIFNVIARSISFTREREHRPDIPSTIFFTKKKKNLRAQVHDESERLFVYITIVSAGTQKADHILNNNVTNRRLPTLESN